MPGLPLSLPPSEGALASKGAGGPPPASLGLPGSSEGLLGLSLHWKLAFPSHQAGGLGCVSCLFPFEQKAALYRMPGVSL